MPSTRPKSTRCCAARCASSSSERSSRRRSSTTAHERFNLALFRKLGELGLLGITVPEKYGGAGMDAVAAVIVHEELSASDPGFTLAYLAHSMLFVNNFARNAQRRAARVASCRSCIAGSTIGGMCMSEPAVGTDVLGMKTTARRARATTTCSTAARCGSPTAPSTTARARRRVPRLRPHRRRWAPASCRSFVVEKGMRRLHARPEDQATSSACAPRPPPSWCFDDCEVPVANRVGDEGDVDDAHDAQSRDRAPDARGDVARHRAALASR